MKCAAEVKNKHKILSLPVRGAWVEISDQLIVGMTIKSLPVRGAWVEISP